MTINQIINVLSPALKSRMLTSEQQQAFECGLDLLSGTIKAQSFVRTSRIFRDYHRRVRQMLTYLQTLNTGGQTTMDNGKRRVGRPTKEEQREYAEREKARILDDAKQSLFPDLVPDLSVRPLTYNGIIANPSGESIAATMPHLSQIRQFLSAPLQEEVNQVRDLRNEMAAKAEQAKLMTEANEQAERRGQRTLYTEEDIAELATRAAEIESDILPNIYQRVDNEMGEYYLRLSQRTGDPEYIAFIERTCSIAPQDLRTMFKPFYEKAQARDPRFAEKVAERIAADRPEVKAARDVAAKHKAEADALIKYITRKDKKPTKTRADGLRKRIAKLRSDYADLVTEEELNGYEAILTHTLSCCEA